MDSQLTLEDGGAIMSTRDMQQLMGQLMTACMFTNQNVNRLTEAAERVGETLTHVQRDVEGLNHAATTLNKKVDDVSSEVKDVKTDVAETQESVNRVESMIETTREEFCVRLKDIEKMVQNEKMNILTSKPTLRRILSFLAEYGMNTALGCTVAIPVFVGDVLCVAISMKLLFIVYRHYSPDIELTQKKLEENLRYLDTYQVKKSIQEEFLVQFPLKSVSNGANNKLLIFQASILHDFMKLAMNNGGATSFDPTDVKSSSLDLAPREDSLVWGFPLCVQVLQQDAFTAWTRLITGRVTPRMYHFNGVRLLEDESLITFDDIERMYSPPINVTPKRRREELESPKGKQRETPMKKRRQPVKEITTPVEKKKRGRPSKKATV